MADDRLRPVCRLKIGLPLKRLGQNDFHNHVQFDVIFRHIKLHNGRLGHRPGT